VSDADRMTPRQWIAGTHVLALREIGAALDSGIAVVAAIAFALLTNSVFMNEFFLTGRVDMSGYFELLPLVLAFFLPAITMRLWAEERRQRTLELLLTLPVVQSQAIAGKYVAALTIYALFLLGSLPIVVMLCWLGDPDLGLIAGGYAGLALFGALFLAFGMFLSALSGDQIVAFVTSTLLGFAFVLTGDERVIAVFDGLAPKLAIGTFLADGFSALPHFESCARGVVTLASLTYFASASALFLWLNALALRLVRT
jgi:ABC-type transport system involved in multi-copper enzyme maturation permease subunit